MKFSTGVRYALRAMVELARRDSAAPVSLAVLAQLQNLPLKYLENIFFHLRRAHLVEAARGVHGGYQLSRPANQISVLDVVRAMDGDVALVECASPGGFCPNHMDKKQCPTHALWVELSRTLSERMAAVTLQSLADNAASLEAFHAES